MTREEHQAAAERILASVQYEMDRLDPTSEVLAEHAVRLAAAQVHATLAGPVRASLVMADGWCACGRELYQHRVTALCGSSPMPEPEPAPNPSHDPSKHRFERARAGDDGPKLHWCIICGRSETKHTNPTSVPSDGPGQ